MSVDIASTSQSSDFAFRSALKTPTGRSRLLSAIFRDSRIMAPRICSMSDLLPARVVRSVGNRIEVSQSCRTVVHVYMVC